MAKLTDTLSQPSGSTATQGAPSTGLAGVATAISGGSNVLKTIGAGLVKRKEKKLDQARADATLEQIDNVLQASGVEAPPSQPLDPSAPTDIRVQRLAQNVSKFQKQAEQQGSSRGTFIRSINLTKQAIQDNPELTADFIAIAKSTLGVSATAELFEESREEEVFQREADLRQRTANINAADAAGVSFGNLEQQERAGQAILIANEDLRQLEQQVATKTAQNFLANGKTMTAKQIAVTQFNIVDKAIDTTYGEVFRSGNQNIKQRAFTARAENNQQEIEIIGQDLLQFEVMWNNTLEDQLRMATDLDPDVADQIRAKYQVAINETKKIFIGDFANATSQGRILDSMNTDLGINFIETAPMSARLGALGDTAVARAIITQITNNIEPIKNILGEEALAVLGVDREGKPLSTTSLPSTGKTQLNQYTDIGEGNLQSNQMSDVQIGEQLSLTDTAFKEYQRDPAELEEPSLNTYGNQAAFILNTANDSSTPSDIEAGAAMVSSAGMLAVFEKYATTAEPAKVQALGTAIQEINAAASASLARKLQPNTFVVGAPVLPGQVQQPLQIEVTETPFFNPDTGRVEIDVRVKEGVGSNAPPALLAKLQKGTAESQALAGVINERLDTVVQFRGFGNKEFDSFSDNELKEAMVGTAGLSSLGGGIRGALDVEALTPETVAPLVEKKGRAPSAKVSDIIKTEATSAGVDINLVRAVAAIESAGNQDAVSSAGAIGVMQLMPATAAGLGVDPNDVTENIRGGVQYLSELLKRYDGDVDLALAAYNAGPGNVDKHGGIPPFEETQAYVKKVRARLNEFNTQE